MPFDPFFSSTNKKHYVPDPEAEALLTKIKSMPINELIDWKRKTYAKPYIERSKAELIALKWLRFNKEKHDSSARKLDGEMQANDLNYAANKFGVTVYQNYGTTGKHFGHQNRGIKAGHWYQPNVSKHTYHDSRARWEASKKRAIKSKKKAAKQIA
jgi:hypothetical protein